MPFRIDAMVVAFTHVVIIAFCLRRPHKRQSLGGAINENHDITSHPHLNHFEAQNYS
jgi:hypothetical protein